MKQAFSSRTFSGEELGRFFEYDVLGQGDEHIGNVSGLWEDHTGKPSFVGVKTTWLIGKTHVIPLHAAHIDAEEGHIYVPYTGDQIKNAPSYDKDEELNTSQEQEIYRYYGIQAPSAGLPTGQEQTRARAQSQPEFRTGAGAPGRGQESTMALHEEQVRVGKRDVEAETVRLRKIVRAETVNQPVELKREDVVIERVPAHEAKGTGQAFSGQEQVIPLRREEAVVEKENIVKEGVRVRKTQETERQNVSADVRREDVEVSRGRNEGEPRRTTDPDKRS